MNSYTNKQPYGKKEYIDFNDSDKSIDENSFERDAITIEDKKISLTKNNKLKKKTTSNVRNEYHFKSKRR